MDNKFPGKDITKEDCKFKFPLATKKRAPRDGGALAHRLMRLLRGYCRPDGWEGSSDLCGRSIEGSTLLH